MIPNEVGMLKKNEAPKPPKLPVNYWAEAQKIFEDEQQKAYDRGWAAGFEAGRNYPRVEPFD